MLLFRSQALPLLLLGCVAAWAYSTTSAKGRPAPGDSALQASSAAGFEGAARAALDGLVAMDPDGQLAGMRGWIARLGDDPAGATRHAVLLGAALADERIEVPARRAAEAALMARLDARIDVGSRWAIGVDVVAARSLDAALDRDVAREQLTSWAAGDRPHPNLAVRVECAASALRLGQKPDAALVEFLLAVLRAETPDQDRSPRSWPRIETLAWVKTHAAKALSAAAETDMRFRPDGPWEHQTTEANRLETRLAD